MHIYLMIEVTDEKVSPGVTISPQDWSSPGRGVGTPDSLGAVRRSSALLDRVLDFAESIRS